MAQLHRPASIQISRCLNTATSSLSQTGTRRVTVSRITDQEVRSDERRRGPSGSPVRRRVGGFDARAPATAPDPRALRRCFGRFQTGVTVVSYHVGDEIRGATVNSFTSVSMDPPLVLVSLARSTQACAALEDVPFAINVLRSDQLDVAFQFAGRARPRLSVKWDTAASDDDPPTLADAVAVFRCRPWRRYDGGDHVLRSARSPDSSTAQATRWRSAMAASSRPGSRSSTVRWSSASTGPRARGGSALPSGSTPCPSTDTSRTGRLNRLSAPAGSAPSPGRPRGPAPAFRPAFRLSPQPPEDR